MPSELKQLMAEEMTRDYPAGTDYVVVGYTGLSGQETTRLRKKMRDGHLRLQAVKNAIAKRVLEAVGLGDGARYVQGPSALVTGDIEMPELCKIVADLAKEYEKKFIVRGGMFDGVGLDADGVGRLADIPPMPVLQAQIIGSVYGRLAGVASAFQSIARSLVYALEGIREKKEGSGTTREATSES